MHPDKIAGLAQKQINNVPSNKIESPIEEEANNVDFFELKSTKKHKEKEIKEEEKSFNHLLTTRKGRVSKPVGNEK
jgi:hypothetical protein